MALVAFNMVLIYARWMAYTVNPQAKSQRFVGILS